jgi:hypothetical protein
MSNKIPRPAVGVVDLKIANDVELELGLAQKRGAMGTLEIIADRGGEIAWSWEGISHATRELVADLIELELVIEREYVTSALQLHGRLTLRLTDKGRNVVEIHRKRKVVASEVRALEPCEVD